MKEKVEIHKRPVKLAPSILAADFARLGEQVLQMIEQVRPECELELDGGIDAATARLGVAAGANVLVAGTSIFGDSEGVAAAMIRLRAATEKPINPEKGSLCA